MSSYPEGIYVLRIDVGEPRELEIGSLTKRKFSGQYLYVGSARGAGGLKRVTRHLEVSSGRNRGEHWHVDYLIEAGAIKETWLIPTEEDLECKLAEELAKLFPQPVEGFGASDCSCASHLFSFEKEKKPELIRKCDEIISEGKPIRFDWDLD